MKKRKKTASYQCSDLNQMNQKKIEKKTRKNVATLFEENCMVFFNAIFPNVILENNMFRNYFRMTVTQLEDLLQIVETSFLPSFLH